MDKAGVDPWTMTAAPSQTVWLKVDIPTLVGKVQRGVSLSTTMLLDKG